MSIRRWVAGLGKGHCTGCGRELEYYTDTYVSNGCSVERRWEACPESRDENGWLRQDHYAVWTRGKVTPLRETTRIA